MEAPKEFNLVWTVELEKFVKENLSLYPLAARFGKNMPMTIILYAAPEKTALMEWQASFVERHLAEECIKLIDAFRVTHHFFHQAFF
jgi:hypothetical protein